MPLDGHAYLVSQGWTGQGTGLRQGAIARPVTVSQKKNLSGIGKDRDEAFPFWDHVFSVAANAIKVKLHDDSDTEDTDIPTPTLEFRRTNTGIISNRRPTSTTPALSGTATPTDTSSSSAPRQSVMAAAKQEAARRALYSMFFRGPIIGSDLERETIVEGTLTVKETNAVAGCEISNMVGVTVITSKKKKERGKEGVLSVIKAEKKRKRDDGAEKTERKKKKAGDEPSEKKKVKVDAVENSRSRGKGKKRLELSGEEGEKGDREEKELLKAERKKRKEQKREKKERKRLKAEKEAAHSTENLPDDLDSDNAHISDQSVIVAEVDDVDTQRGKKRKEGDKVSKHKKKKRKESS